MEPNLKINDFVKHTETGEVYKVIEVNIEKYQVFYKLKTDEEIMIETLYPENVLESDNQ